MVGQDNIIGKGFDVNPQNINLAGKIKGTRNRATIYREHLEKAGKNGLVVDDCVLAAINQALTGDIQALKELMDSGYGKNPDKLDQTIQNAPGEAFIVTDNHIKQAIKQAQDDC